MSSKKIMYLDCASGISGDMFVGAMLDLGADTDVLANVLNSIPEQGFQYEISRVKKAGIDCCDFNVILEEDNHDHDMEYLEGHEHNHHEEEHKHHHHEHTHRHYSEVKEILEKTDMTDGARAVAERIFEIIASAEAKAHDLPIDEVHFHEVGAIDSIVDVISAAVCYDNLGITDTIVPLLYEGTGTVRCQHGIIPVPVPAVMNIIEAEQMPLRIIDHRGEIMTPTGCAIASSIVTSNELPLMFHIVKTGIGAGKRDTGLSGMLRAVMIEEDQSDERLFKLETNIDDSTGEQIGAMIEALFEAGAKDVHTIPCYMKKNRPGFIVTVITEEKDIETLENIIFRDSTTLGVRRWPIETTSLERKEVTVNTPYGKAKAKLAIAAGNLRVYPEYESVKEIARREEIGYMDAYEAVVSAYDRENETEDDQ